MKYKKDSIDLLIGNYEIALGEGIMLENTPVAIEANKRFLAVSIVFFDNIFYFRKKAN